MNENTSKKVLENVKKGDSTNKVDVVEKKEIISIEDRIINAPYKKITDYTPEEVKVLPRFKVVISCFERVYNGQVSSYPSLTLVLGQGFELQVKKSEFNLIAFTNLKENHLVPKLGMDRKAEVFEGYFPVRFCKGRKELSDGTISEFYYAQIVIKKGTVYSVYLNKRDGALELFESRVNKGLIKFEGWILNDKVKKIDIDPEDDNYIYE